MPVLKKRIPYVSITLLTITTLILILSCNKENPVGTESKEFEDLFPEVFVKKAAVEDITHVIEGDTTSSQYVKNQLVLLVDTNNISSDSVVSLSRERGATVVGQIPPFGMYQLEYNNMTVEALSDERAHWKTLSNVKAASFNLIAEARGNTAPAYCSRDDDNHKLTGYAAEPYNFINYSAMVTIMGKVKELHTLSNVKVGMFDTGLNPNATEFTNLRKFNITNNKESIIDLDNSGHGTMTTGILAADNNEKNINGIASRVLGDKLEVGIAYGTLPLTSIFCDIFAADLFYEIDICNMSFGYKNEKTSYLLDDARLLFDCAISCCPDILFVVSSANDNSLLTTTNDAPAGLQLDNIITVGGVACDDKMKKAENSAYGPLIDIAAPAELIQCVDPNGLGDINSYSGNSLATPMVTSLAAILKSINPNLTPKEIKNYITTYSYATDIEVGGNLLSLPLPIEQLLIDMNANSDLMKYIDVNQPLGEWDLPSAVCCRICNNTEITVYNEKTYHFETDSLGGVLNAGVIANSFKNEETIFALNLYDYQILEDTFYIRNQEASAGAFIANFTQSHLVNGTTKSAISGKLSFSRATVIERDPVMDNPLVVHAEGSFQGIFEYIDTDGKAKKTDFDGYVNLPITIMPFSTDMDVVNYFETACENGKNN